MYVYNVSDATKMLFRCANTIRGQYLHAPLLNIAMLSEIKAPRGLGVKRGGAVKNTITTQHNTNHHRNINHNAHKTHHEEKVHNQTCMETELQLTHEAPDMCFTKVRQQQENRPAHMLPTRSRGKLQLPHNTATTFPETGVKFTKVESFRSNLTLC